MSVAPNDYTFHPMADCWPRISADELAGLSESIKKVGLLHPIWVRGQVIIDGRERYTACAVAGVPPIFAELPAEANVVDIIKAENNHRRHSEPSVRKVAIAKMHTLATKYGEKEKVVEMAKAEGISERDLQRTARVVANGTPELVAQVSSGKVSVAKAEAEVKKTNPSTKKPPEKKKPRVPSVASAVAAASGTPAADAFASGALWDEAEALWKRLLAVYGEIARTESGWWLRKDMSLGADLSTWTHTELEKDHKLFKDLRPTVAECPYCKAGDKIAAKCPACDNRKWVCKYAWDKAPQEYKDKITGGAS